MSTQLKCAMWRRRWRATPCSHGRSALHGHGQRGRDEAGAGVRGPLRAETAARDSRPANPVGDAGATELADGLAGKMRSPDRRRRATKLDEALALHSNLTKLARIRSEISDAGAARFGHGLALSSTLKELSIDFNQRGDAAGLFEGLASNRMRPADAACAQERLRRGRHSRAGGGAGSQRHAGGPRHAMVLAGLRRSGAAGSIAGRQHVFVRSGAWSLWHRQRRCNTSGTSPRDQLQDADSGPRDE